MFLWTQGYLLCSCSHCHQIFIKHPHASGAGLSTTESELNKSNPLKQEGSSSGFRQERHCRGEGAQSCLHY